MLLSTFIKDKLNTTLFLLISIFKDHLSQHYPKYLKIITFHEHRLIIYYLPVNSTQGSFIKHFENNHEKWSRIRVHVKQTYTLNNNSNKLP